MKRDIIRLLKGSGVDFGKVTIQKRTLYSRNHEYTGYMLSTAFPFNLPLSNEELKEVGELLIKISEQVTNIEQFKDGCTYYFINENGDIVQSVFEKNAFCFAMLQAGNAFLSEDDAKKARGDIFGDMELIRRTFCNE